MLAAHWCTALRQPTSIEYGVSIPEPPEPQGTASPKIQVKGILDCSWTAPSAGNNFYIPPRLALQAGLRASLCLAIATLSPAILVGIPASWHPCTPCILTSWHPGNRAPRRPVILAIWRPDILPSWHPGDLASWQPGDVTSWQFGDLASWIPGKMTFLHPDILAS